MVDVKTELIIISRGISLGLHILLANHFLDAVIDFAEEINHIGEKHS